jgi:hypothetical protein
VRHSVACAVYRRRFKEWPSEARLAPLILWDIGQLLDAANFVSLAARLRLKTSENAQISVGRRAGHRRPACVTPCPVRRLSTLLRGELLAGRVQVKPSESGRPMVELLDPEQVVAGREQRHWMSSGNR